MTSATVTRETEVPRAATGASVVSLALSVKSQARRVSKETDKLRRMAAQLAEAVLEDNKDTLEGDTDGSNSSTDD